MEEKPILIGLLVDVSGTMIKSIKNEEGIKKSRLESFRSSFDELITEAIKLCKKPNTREIVSLVKIFALGFGFIDFRALFFGKEPNNVRSLLKKNLQERDVYLIEELANSWEIHQDHIESLVPWMFGDTPMLKALSEAKKIIDSQRNLISNKPIIFILSDGNNGTPSDALKEDIIKFGNKLKEEGIVILSCYLSETDYTNYKVLYENIEPDWPEGAKLMFNLASKIPKNSQLLSYLKEYEWEFSEHSYFFSQVNQSKALKEFLSIVLSGLKIQEIKEKISKKVIDLITKDRLEAALDILLEEFGKKYLNEYFNEIITYKARNDSNNKDRRSNLITIERHSVERTQIISSVLHIVNNYNENKTGYNLEDVEQTLLTSGTSHKKPVTLSSTNT